MIKNILKNIVTKKNHVSLINKNYKCFSTKQAPQKNTLEDWQYVQLISKQIKNNDINQALSHLIQSHLNNQILNKQIYYSLHQKMIQLSSSQGYHQILYKLYRQHFQPNPMTLNWIKKISKTQNVKLSNILKEDLQKLNQCFPQSGQTISQTKQNLQTQTKKQSESEQLKTHNPGRKSRKVPTAPNTDDYFSKSPQTIIVTKKQNVQKPIKEQVSRLQKQPTKEQIQLQTINQIKQTIQMMFKQYGKITLHNVQLELNDQLSQYDINQQMSQMYNENEQQFKDEQIEEHQQQTMNDYVLQMLSSISKIKIGKIQFQNSSMVEKFNQQFNNKNHNNKPQN